MYFVYIIKSEITGELYRGFTELLPMERLNLHNKGTVPSTKDKRPWKLVWCAAFTSKQRALNFESYLKSGSGHSFSYKRLI